MTSTNEERELKLIVPIDWDLPADRLGDLDVNGEAVVDLVATYYDTDDLRLARSGASLRYRRPEGWMVKLPDAGTQLMERTEVTLGEASPGPVPDELVDLVTGLTRGEPIRAVARIHTERRARAVVDDRGRRVAELTDDRVDVKAVGDAVIDLRQFRELEIELSDGARPKAARQIARALRHAGADADEPLPKIVRALGPRARRSPDLPPAPHIDASSTVADLVAGSLRRSVGAIVDHDARLRLGDDPDDIHDTRVAVRRLRADLRTFRAVLRSGALGPVREELAWLGGLLGAVRDADVLSENIVRSSVELREMDQIESLRLQHQLGTERRGAYQHLLGEMRTARYVGLLDRLVELAQDPPVRRKVADVRAVELAPRLMAHPWEQLTDVVDALADPPEDAELHAVRIAAKKVRYAAEVLTPVVGRDARRLAKQLARLQDELGAHQDAVVGRRWLTAAAAVDESDGYSAFVAGEIAHSLLVRQEEIRTSWRERWAKVERRGPAHWKVG